MQARTIVQSHAGVERGDSIERGDEGHQCRQRGTPVSLMGDTAATKGDTVSNLSMLVHGCFQSKPMNKHNQITGARLRRARALIVREVSIEASALPLPMSWHEQHNQKRSVGHSWRSRGTNWHKP